MHNARRRAMKAPLIRLDCPMWCTEGLKQRELCSNINRIAEKCTFMNSYMYIYIEYIFLYISAKFLLYNISRTCVYSKYIVMKLSLVYEKHTRDKTLGQFLERLPGSATNLSNAHKERSGFSCPVGEKQQ